IAEYLAGLCRSPYQVPPPRDALEYLLLNGRAVVIFDGLDEVFDIGARTNAIEAIHGFAHRYPNTPVLVTSRGVGYGEFPLAGARSSPWPGGCTPSPHVSMTLPGPG